MASILKLSSLLFCERTSRMCVNEKKKWGDVSHTAAPFGRESSPLAADVHRGGERFDYARKTYNCNIFY